MIGTETGTGRSMIKKEGPKNTIILTNMRSQGRGNTEVSAQKIR